MKRIPWVIPSAAILLLPVLAGALQDLPPRPLPNLEYRTERPGGGGDDPVISPRDLTGRSIKTPRVRVLHARDPRLAGTSAHFLFVDPWLGYQRGRELFLREFGAWEGVFGESGQHGGPLLDDGVTRQQALGHVSSCGMCHNTPYRDAGAGVTIAKNGGDGRNTPHLFGGGLLEMIGWQTRLKLMALGDTDRDGWISLRESVGRRALVENLPASIAGRRTRIDFGRFGDADGDGKPDLDPAIHIIYVDAAGHRIPWARSLKVAGVAGYTLDFQVFGFGHRARVPIASTLRAFTAQPWDIHSGLQAHDPTCLIEPRSDGLAGVSLAGARQFITSASRDRGKRLLPAPPGLGVLGISLDDPDRDGVVEEISEGDLDLAEWYLLNHPAPAEGPPSPRVRHGRSVFTRIGCASCHVPDWHLEAARPEARDYTQRTTGDRRFFNLQVRPGPGGELQGRVRLLADRSAGRWRRRFGAFTIRGLYSDLRYHDLGPEAWQTQFDGSTLRRFRTPPLWGVGSSMPYWHDGGSLTLHDAVLRHGGEAGRSRSAYRALRSSDREALIDFLNSLILYGTDRLPTDINGDGRIDRHFRVAGQNTGLEVFNPEWLFNTPGRIEGPVTAPDGRRIVSRALTNVHRAYGLDLPYVRDRDRDGFPDILSGPNPNVPSRAR